MNLGRRILVLTFAVLSFCAASWPIGSAGHASAQGLTTGGIAGVVTSAQKQPVGGASVIAIHEPSGTTYEATTRADGRYSIPNMRVGGPYTIQVVFVGGGGTAFAPQTRENITVNLGVNTDIDVNVEGISVTEEVTVSAQTDPVFASSRTGAATSLAREELATLPTITGRLESMTRLSPQSTGTMSFAGQDNRLNNITVDGSAFNNSFGIGSTPGERTGVAPISLAAIEQIQISVAPFDVRQGSFVGAAVNTVTRSGTNQISGSVYRQFRDGGLVGKKAKDLPFNPGDFTYGNTGVWVGGPIAKNKLFYFVNFEDETKKEPGTTYRANTGGEAAAGSVTRVLASDLDTLSNFMRTRFNYETGGYQGYNHEVPATRFLVKTDYNLNNTNKITFRYNHLDSFTDVLLSNSSSLGNGSRRTSTQALNFQNSNYQIMENIRSGIAEWNTVLGRSMANQLMGGYTTQDESRNSRGDLFPFIDILDGSAATYTSVGFEPFTPNNELRYKTLQMQNNFTKFGEKHALTLGGSFERYESENVFFSGRQGVFIYNTLADFYADANGHLANPNRTTSNVTLRRFQLRYMNIPNAEKPVQPLEVMYAGAYAQDDWQVSGNLKVNAGVRLDIPFFGDTAFANPNADAATFRDESGQAVKYESGKLPDPKILWSPRVGFNWNVSSDHRTQVRGGTGIFTGKPAYVWISNQIGTTGMLTGFIDEQNVTTRPFHPDPNHYRDLLPAPTGAPAGSYELAVTDPHFKFPQLWRTNIAVDRRLPGGWTGTGEFIYNRDVNGVYYINANLPAAQATFAGADGRPRYVGTSCTLPTAGPCATRLNNAAGNQISNATVLKNQNVGTSWNASGSMTKSFRAGFFAKGAYSYGESKNTVDPGSVAFGSWQSNPISGDPNNPAVGYSQYSPGHRVFLTGSYTKEYFSLGSTTLSFFWEAKTIGNASYVYAGDLNGDTGANNDLIYIPRNTSEMNFSAIPAGTVSRAFTPDEQAAAWDTFINQDAYLSKRRGEYAQRGGVFLPMVRRMDFSVAQDVFRSLGGKRHAFQVRFDVLNFGNLLNENWGVSQRLINSSAFSPFVTQPLTNAGVDAQGRPTYRLRVNNGELIRSSLEQTASEGDVYRVQISLKYTFN